MSRFHNPPEPRSEDGPLPDADRAESGPRTRGARLVQAQILGGVLAEWYHDDPGPPVTIERHVHDTFQLGLALDRGGEYAYRGARVPVPVRRLIVLHPGEPHSVRDLEPRRVEVRYRMIYVDPELFQSTASELIGKRTGVPFFPEMSPGDGDLAWRYASIFEEAAEQLERDHRLTTFLADLTARHAQNLPSPIRFAAAGPQVRRVREYLREHYAAKVSLAELSELADLSPYYLLRAFQREEGVPPHTYQRQVRIEHAKRLIARGLSLSRVAIRTGFFDQSHLGRHFRRLVGVSPGRYVHQGQ